MQILKIAIYKEVQNLANLSQNAWLKEDIDKRNEDIYTRLKNFFEEK